MYNATATHALWVRALALGLGLLCAAVPAAPAQEPAAGQTIRGIEVRQTGVARVSDPGSVLALTSARVGGHAVQADLSRDQRALLDTGLFADVRVLVEPADNDGVRIIYEVQRRLRFRGPADISGNKEISAKKLRDILGIVSGDLVDEAILAARCDLIRDEYRKRYYSAARITGRLTPLEEGWAGVAVEIEEGTRRKVSNFVFSGNRAISDKELREALGKPGRLNPFWFFYTGWRRRAADFEGVGDAVSNFYRSRGHLDVRVEPPVLTTGKDGDPVLAVTIDEGPVYRIGEIEVTGVTLFPRREVAQAPAELLRRGDIADPGLVQKASRALRDYYGARGYVDTTVRTATTATGGDPQRPVANISFDIREGVLAHVRNIAIRGNTRTKDKVIRREITLFPGMIRDEVQAERSRQRLENLGYFESVRYHEEPDRDDPTRREVVYEVVEKNTGNFMVGVGFSSVENVIGFVEVSQANFDLLNWPYFHGGGQKLRASLEMGSETKNVVLSLTEPWFMDRRLSLTVDAYRRELSYNEFDVTRIGGGASLTVPLKYGRGSIGYGFDIVTLDDLIQGDYTFLDDPGRVYRYTDEDDDYNKAPLRLTWLYDTRNRSFVPTSGTRGSIFAEYSGTATGGDHDIYKLGTDYRHWIPLWAGHVLSLSFRAETVDSLDSDDPVPIGDRLFLGGGRTLRGFRYRDVGPKVIPTPDNPTGRSYRPVGGLTMAMASAEYTVPLFKVLRLAAFCDVGGAWSDSFDISTDNLASSAGVGIRFDFPGFPIRVDYAMPIDDDDDYTRRERFVLWIGFE